ncbi:XRE family transcriptional regulator [Mesorhizobium sp. M1428]|uniref:XRE family transcriptional regulator n=1 Tax=unclassified Mesorhizobium TaxID=325217 RepID=UPI00333D9825
MNDNEKLAQEVKKWRAKGGFTAEAAAKVLGIPKRTFEGIEQARGFPYPVLLRVAMESIAASHDLVHEKVLGGEQLRQKPRKRV